MIKIREILKNWFNDLKANKRKKTIILVASGIAIFLLLPLYTCFFYTDKVPFLADIIKSITQPQHSESNSEHNGNENENNGNDDENNGNENGQSESDGSSEDEGNGITKSLPNDLALFEDETMHNDGLTPHEFQEEVPEHFPHKK